MRKAFTAFAACIFFYTALAQPEERIDKFTFIDSAMTLIKLQSYKGWTAAKYGTRIVLTHNDSVCIATSYSDFKPEKSGIGFTTLKYKYQLFIDFVDKELDFTKTMNRTVNDSIDKIIASFSRKKYARGEYYTHLEIIELLNKIKIKENSPLNNFDLHFSDNLAPGWIPFNRDDVKYFPFEPPTRFQKNVEGMKRKIADMLVEWGI